MRLLRKMIICTSSAVKSRFAKACLLLVMILLGFKVSVFFLGWPGSKVNVVHAKEQSENPEEAIDRSVHSRQLSKSEYKQRLPLNTTAVGVANPTLSHHQRHPAAKLAPPTNSPPVILKTGPNLKPPKPKLNPVSGVCKCTDKLCYNCLQSKDKKFYNQCLNQTMEKYVNMSLTVEEMQGGCRFMDGRKRAAVALVGFPGSGNTWVRGLLEHTTGYCTGAVYCDEMLRKSGMTGEGVRSGAVLVTKTHYVEGVTWTLPDRPKLLYFPKWKRAHNEYHPAYGSAILLVRNPFNAFISEYTRNLYALVYKDNMSNEHVKRMDNASEFGNNTRWNNFTKRSIHQWKAYFSAWVVGGAADDRKVLVVRYEDLKLDTPKQVLRMLDFLDVDYKEEEVRNKLNEQGYEAFRRNQSNVTFEHYTKSQRLQINKTISDTMSYLRNKTTSTLGLEQYLWH